MPRSLPPTTSHSPVWRPIRRSTPISRTDPSTARAHLMAEVEVSKDARKPSPAVSISRPPNRRCSAPTRALCTSRRSAHSRSPSARACSVEPTTSVNMTVATTRVGSAWPRRLGRGVPYPGACRPAGARRGAGVQRRPFPARARAARGGASGRGRRGRSAALDVARTRRALPPFLLGQPVA